VKRKILLLLVVLIFVVTGCGKEKIKETANVDSRDHEAYYSFTDSLGNSVVLYDEAAVLKNKLNKQGEKLPCGCPGTQSKTIRRETSCEPVYNNTGENKSQLSQWPVQIKLVPVNAPYFANANLLIAADCTAYAYGNFCSIR